MDSILVFGVRDNAVEDGLQKAYGLHEAVAFDGHNHVDRVEVSFASKTSREVGVGVDGGVKVMALRTHEAESAIMGLGDDFEHIGDQWDDLDAVAQFTQMLL